VDLKEVSACFGFSHNVIRPDRSEKVPFAYQEGLFCTVAHTRFSAVAVGSHGPDLVIGKATTQGFHQSILSKRLNPPVKWSYRKLILW